MLKISIFARNLFLFRLVKNKGMKKILVFITFSFLFSCCTEEGEDANWKLQEQKEASKKEILKNIEEIFEVALKNPEKAEKQLAQLNRKTNNTTPIIDNDAEVLSVKKVVEKVIAVARFRTILEKNMEKTDYTQMALASVARKEKRDIPPSDIGLLLHYERYFKQALAPFKKETALNEDMLKKMEEYTVENIELVQNKIKSYKELTGKESMLEGREWRLIDYDVKVELLFSGVNPIIEKGVTDYLVKFKPNNQFECDSVLLSNFYIPSKWDYSSSYDTVKEILGRGQAPYGSSYHAGKQIQKNGEYYFGDNYLTFVFHCVDGYDMVISMNYDDKIYKKSNNEKIVPLRNPPAYYYMPLGDTRVYFAVINSEKHCGATVAYDTNFYRRGLNNKPFGWIQAKQK